MIVVRSQPKQPQGRDRSHNGTQSIHHSLEPESPSVGIRRNPGGQQSLSSRSSNTTPKPGGGARHQNVPRTSCQCQRAGSQRRENVATLHQGFSVFQSICVVSGCEFGEARKAVRCSLDRAQPARPCAQRCEKSRQNGSGDFVAPVAEQAGKPDSQGGAVQPRRPR